MGTQGLVGSGSAEGFFVVGMDRKTKKKQSQKNTVPQRLTSLKLENLEKRVIKKPINHLLWHGGMCFSIVGRADSWTG